MKCETCLNTVTYSQCSSHRIVSITGKTSDQFFMEWWDGKEQGGYVCSAIGINKGDSDYIEFELCTMCGQIQDYKSKMQTQYKDEL